MSDGVLQSATADTQNPLVNPYGEIVWPSGRVRVHQWWRDGEDWLELAARYGQPKIVSIPTYSGSE